MLQSLWHDTGVLSVLFRAEGGGDYFDLDCLFCNPAVTYYEALTHPPPPVPCEVGVRHKKNRFTKTDVSWLAFLKLSNNRRCDLCLHSNRPLLKKKTVYVMFRRAKRRVVMVRFHTLSRWLPKNKGFARRYARESCYGLWVTSEVTSSIGVHNLVWMCTTDLFYTVSISFKLFYESTRSLRIYTSVQIRKIIYSWV